MVRNSKRRAFTIVELVIVIAVIAILAAVMIPTFGGVIESANVSADKQILSTVNSQIAIYTGLGNKIETEADLWKALKGDFNGGSDMTAKFDPRSAKNGYHYWYDATEQEPIVKLLTYEEVIGTKSVSMGKMFVRAAATREAVNFAPAAPRSVVPNYYFLDTKCENKNEIASFFDLMANMSDKTKDDYKKAIADLKAIKGDNKTLAEAVVARMSETAIVTDKGAFIDTTTDTIKYIYIPENNTADKTGYYLSHTVIHVNDADVKDLLAIATGATGSVIELPADIKVAEGSLEGFSKIVIKTQADGVEGIKAIFSAGSVASDATILDKNGASYTINGADIMQGETKVGTLAYRNPVTGFDISADGNVAIRTGNNYIALDKIKNGITLTGTTSNFTAADANLAIYTGVVWSTETAGVSIDEKTGVVTFADDFNGETVTIKATAVAVNEGTVEKEFTMTVVRITGATVEFMSGTNSGSQTIANGQTYKPDSFLVTYEDAETTANFKELINPTYGNGITFSTEETEKLGLTAPNVVFTTTGDYFTVGTDKNFAFTILYEQNGETLSKLNGTIGEQNVTATVSDNAGDAFSATITVTVNDNTNAPFKPAIPSYTNGYVYKVGNASTIALEEFFAEKAGLENLSEYKIYVYAQEPQLDGDGYYHFGTPVMAEENPTITKTLDFAGKTGYHWIVLATVSGETGENEVVIEGIEKQETISMVKVEVIPGTNITDKSPMFTYDEANKTYGYEIYTQDVVLHDNIDLIGQSNKSLIILDESAKLYGNYFAIKAKAFKDTDSSTADEKTTDGPKEGVPQYSGYGLITLRGKYSEINELILDGPVYPEIATGSSTNGYYMFGAVVIGDSCKINNSYLYGFQSPVRIQTRVTTTFKGTTLEAGTWSNLWVTQATKVVLEDVTTIQKAGGYAPDFGGTKNVLGMGIYLHDDMNGKTITIELKGDTKQYNWIDSTVTEATYAGSVGLANTIIFAKTGNSYTYGELFHYAPSDTNKEHPYANAAIAYQAVDFPSMEYYASMTIFGQTVGKWTAAGALLGKISDAFAKSPAAPTINVVDKDNKTQYIDEGKTADLQDKLLSEAMTLYNLLPEAAKSLLDSFGGASKVRCDVDVWATSTVHDDKDGTCEACLGSKGANGNYVVDFSKTPDTFAAYNPVSNYNN